MKLALFTSVGSTTNCIDYYLSEMRGYCDLFINYYGSDEKNYSVLQQYCKYSDKKHDTKFPSLKRAFENSDIGTYDYIFVLDDDCTVENGRLLDIPNIMSRYNLDIASGCHSAKGIVSHPIMHYHQGNHIFRYTNFVEMNFPVFSQNALKKYMSVYDGQLCGWGNDWLYLHTLNCNTVKNCGIVDSVCIKNPDHYSKKYDTIDKFMSRDNRRIQWETLRHKLQCHEWHMKTLDFVYA